MDNENRLSIFKRDRWRCVVCHEHVGKYGTPMLAHLIPKKKHYLKTYGADIIHHSLNLASTCCLAHNAKMDINGHTMKINELVERIRLDIIT